MKLLTWNVYFGPESFMARRDALFRELEAHAPDVILLQEVVPDLLTALAREPWAGAYHWSDDDGSTLGGYGVLALTRAAPRQLTFHELPSDMGRRLLVVELDDATVATVHLESISYYADVRAEQLRRILAILDGIEGDVVLAGDMNFAPDAPLENAALDPRYVDVWPALRANDPGFTIDTDINAMRYAIKGGASHRRIDRVFHRRAQLTPTIIELVGTAPIDPDGETFVSDHFGLLTTFTRSPPAPT